MSKLQTNLYICEGAGGGLYKIHDFALGQQVNFSTPTAICIDLSTFDLLSKEVLVISMSKTSKVKIRATIKGYD